MNIRGGEKMNEDIKALDILRSIIKFIYEQKEQFTPLHFEGVLEDLKKEVSKWRFGVTADITLELYGDVEKAIREKEPLYIKNKKFSSIEKVYTKRAMLDEILGNILWYIENYSIYDLGIKEPAGR